jgi:hypothetical protein
VVKTVTHAVSPRDMLNLGAIARFGSELHFSCNEDEGEPRHSTGLMYTAAGFQGCDALSRSHSTQFV